MLKKIFVAVCSASLMAYAVSGDDAITPTKKSSKHEVSIPNDVACSPEETVRAVKDSKPLAMDIEIHGARFGEHTLYGLYKYFDLNNDPQTSSLFEWSVIKNNVVTVVSRQQSYTLQMSDEGKGNQIRFCVTPLNEKEQGDIQCVTEDIAWFEGFGEFKEGGVITPYLVGYPNFKLSYWKSASNMLTAAMALDLIHDEVKPLTIDTADPSFSNLYPISLCVSLDHSIQNDDDICREMKASSNLNGGMVFDFNDTSRVAMNYKREVNVTVAGQKYRIRRPYTWAEFQELNLDKDPKFLSAEPSTMREGFNTVRGVKMTPIQANNFCLRAFGAPGLISSSINLSDGVIPSGKHQWPIYLALQTYVTKEPSGKFVIDSNRHIPADMNSKYAFACMASVP